MSIIDRSQDQAVEPIPEKTPASIRTPRRKHRRIYQVLKGILITLCVIILLCGSLYTLAYFNTGNSFASRLLVWQDASAKDFNRFTNRPVENAGPVYNYQQLPANNIYSSAFQTVTTNNNDYGDNEDFNKFLTSTGTTSFLVIKDNQIIYQNYYNGYNSKSEVTSFSIAKSFTSALIGIAIQDGYIQSVNTPITQYIPELAKRDPRFEKITIQNLLTMTSGIQWHTEANPLLSDDAKTYYDPNLRALALNCKIATAPGKTFVYNPYNALLLGMILERTTHQTVSHYLQEKIWKPLGMQAPGSWSLDSAQDGFEKLESGINGEAIDFAKFGSLYLNDGKWNGKQVIPAAWIKESTSASTQTDPDWFYQYFWWISSRDGVNTHYSARGNKGEFIYLMPDQNMEIVRFGTEYGYDSWPAFFESIGVKIAAIDSQHNMPASLNTLGQPGSSVPIK
jgi:CubicO group peptidase (beta-lactamase class C family)